ncbi:MAG TPA: LapA family protein [Chitinivibrionales bacterium]|nr:LapA family protein [Chitinivibrionales bacterium]
MVFIRWAIVFVISFAIAVVIIVNFSKPEFGVQVPAWFFFYQTKPHPVWHYVSAALGLGLAVGLSIAAYYIVTLRAKIYKKDKQIKQLEAERAAGAAPPPAAMDQAQDFVEPVGDDTF